MDTVPSIAPRLLLADCAGAAGERPVMRALVTVLEMILGTDRCLGVRLSYGDYVNEIVCLRAGDPGASEVPVRQGDRVVAVLHGREGAGSMNEVADKLVLVSDDGRPVALFVRPGLRAWDWDPDGLSISDLVGLLAWFETADPNASRAAVKALARKAAAEVQKMIHHA